MGLSELEDKLIVFKSPSFCEKPILGVLQESEGCNSAHSENCRCDS